MVWSRFRELKSGIVQHYQDFSRLPRCAFQWASKSPLGRTAPDSRFPIPNSRFPIPDSRFPIRAF
ncbi:MULTISPECIES: hypothetical protein [unclassified Moorena]|uniref:hypothetical protein n=1 Tax=unclassified Moorena TaxID=2683338 RepID=UPI0014018E7B|nr:MULTISPECIES: hypothetical protein [unclassified Moorena]NEO17672.1 hypothetical protein [Moorena sp. SIO3E8]NEQ04216.1 hypothetical protein [Moorena sp. SIO3F7]